MASTGIPMRPGKRTRDIIEPETRNKRLSCLSPNAANQAFLYVLERDCVNLAMHMLAPECSLLVSDVPRNVYDEQAFCSFALSASNGSHDRYRISG